MIPRELHFDEGKLAVTRVDACDESVMGHIRFLAKRERFMFECKRKKAELATVAGNS
jgi:hypothetical protein